MVSYMNLTLAITNAVCRFPFRFGGGGGDGKKTGR
jgi:hypothetical protein